MKQLIRNSSAEFLFSQLENKAEATVSIGGTVQQGKKRIVHNRLSPCSFGKYPDVWPLEEVMTKEPDITRPVLTI